MNFLQDFLDKFIQVSCERYESLEKHDDIAPIVLVFVILIVGSCIALSYVPPSLRVQNISLEQFSKLNLGSLLQSFQFLSFAVTLSLAQIPLEFLESENRKIKASFKAIFAVGAAGFAYMAFLYSY